MRSPSMGWKTYAAVLIIIAGSFNIIDGLVAIVRTNYFERVLGSTVELPITNNIKTWGWVALIIGIVMVLAGLAVLTGAMWARIVGVAVLAGNMLFQFAYLAHYPFWSFTMLLIDAFAIYGLIAHGGREVEAPPSGAYLSQPIDLTQVEPRATNAETAPTGARVGP